VNVQASESYPVLDRWLQLRLLLANFLKLVWIYTNQSCNTTADPQASSLLPCFERVSCLSQWQCLWLVPTHSLLEAHFFTVLSNYWHRTVSSVLGRLVIYIFTIQRDVNCEMQRDTRRFSGPVSQEFTNLYNKCWSCIYNHLWAILWLHDTNYFCFETWVD
jgi:hypothetical protein